MNGLSNKFRKKQIHYNELYIHNDIEKYKSNKLQAGIVQQNIKSLDLMFKIILGTSAFFVII